ncbi:PREDICTED: SPATS2-like protein, partial [Chlamydotis macqueenii]|uniref:SPATS2-like protein n=1 Tax=Chlamydotis macqueenii TaxID=187382 RepID=UPI000529CB15
MNLGDEYLPRSLITALSSIMDFAIENNVIKSCPLVPEYLKINAIRSIVPNKSNNEIVLVLQQFDNNVDKAVQAFMDGSATQVLKEWNMTGKKKNNRRKRSKSKQHQGNKDPKNKNGGPEKAAQESQGVYDCHLNGCSKDNSCSGSANQKLEATSLENKGSGFVESALVCPEIT